MKKLLLVILLSSISYGEINICDGAKEYLKIKGKSFPDGFPGRFRIFDKEGEQVLQLNGYPILVYVTKLRKSYMDVNANDTKLIIRLIEQLNNMTTYIDAELKVIEACNEKDTSRLEANMYILKSFISLLDELLNDKETPRQRDARIKREQDAEKAANLKAFKAKYGIDIK